MGSIPIDHHLNMIKRFTSISDLSFKDYIKIIKLSFFFERVRIGNSLLNKRVAIVFDSPSTRTRISTEIALKEMGANVVFLEEKNMQSINGERNKETCKVLSNYFDIIFLRTKSKKKMEDFKKYIKCILVNSLDRKEHPCQVFNDIFTCYKKNIYLKKKKIAWIGKKNNMFNSWAKASKIFDFKILTIMPKKDFKRVSSKRVKLEKSIKNVFKKSDVINTDTWLSIGEKKKRKYKKLRVRKKMFRFSKKNAVFLHCLPAYIGKEVDSKTIYSKKSLVFEQSLNKICTTKAIIHYLVGCA
ncbi:Ornithine carbamoyltransferase [Candidatus Vidania fulgoroideae]|nr:Ornithine carbamoyltransferase [Candidatus Vidania fulgoroideae]